MKEPIGIKRFTFYFWVVLIWTAIWLLHYSIEYPDTFYVRIPNELWRNVYLVVVAILFFEYVWPYVIKRRKYIVFNILIGIFSLWVVMMLISFGLYAWRQFGIALGIYTGLRKDETIKHAVAYQTQSGVMFMFITGIARHIYNYIKLVQVTQKLR
ncbi:MAG: hypothetical protein WCF67_00375, partial [Chitinophagaceae bacterium]